MFSGKCVPELCGVGPPSTTTDNADLYGYENRCGCVADCHEAHDCDAPEACSDLPTPDTVSCLALAYAPTQPLPPSQFLSVWVRIDLQLKEQSHLSKSEAPSAIIEATIAHFKRATHTTIQRCLLTSALHVFVAQAHLLVRAQACLQRTGRARPLAVHTVHRTGRIRCRQ